MTQQQEEGWPLGLQPLKIRAGMARNRGFSGSISFNTLLTSSRSSSAASSDLDTESTGSFFHDNSITLGSLIGVSSFLELSRRSARARSRSEPLSSRSKKSSKPRGWFLSLCARTENANNAPSLGHFLEVERRASNDYKISQSPSTSYDPNEFTNSEANLLFINGHVAPPHSSPWFRSNGGGRANRSLTHFNAVGVPVLCSRMCGRRTN